MKRTFLLDLINNPLLILLEVWDGLMQGLISNALLHLRCYFGAQVVSLVFTQSHCLPRPVVLVRALLAWHCARPQIPKSFNSLVVVLPTKPLQPTSNGLFFSVLKALSLIGLLNIDPPGHSQIYDVNPESWESQLTRIRCCPGLALG